MKVRLANQLSLLILFDSFLALHSMFLRPSSFQESAIYRLLRGVTAPKIQWR